jgi:hypothetical protein
MTLSGTMSVSMAFSPAGHLFVEPDAAVEPKLSQEAAARLTEAFADSTSHGLELLVSEFLREQLPPAFVFWRGFAERLFTGHSLAQIVLFSG